MATSEASPEELMLELRGLYASLSSTITNLTSSHSRPKQTSLSSTQQPFSPLSMNKKTEDGLIESVRRLTELVCIGDARFDPTSLEDNNTEVNLFEYFCEKNVLAMMIDLVTGLAMSYPVNTTTTDEASPTDLKNRVLVLPTESVAVQIIQSISILIVTVKNMTSLYYLLSNNYINELIELDISMYDADTSSNISNDNDNDNSIKTVFVNFLKSLAMKIDGLTIQFFMKMMSNPPTRHHHHHHHHNHQQQQQGIDTSCNIKFPLYTAALNFCGIDNDSFVRLTALNICLNVLKLTSEYEGSKTENKSTEDSSVVKLTKSDAISIVTFTTARENSMMLIQPITEMIMMLSMDVQNQLTRNFEEILGSGNNSPANSINVTNIYNSDNNSNNNKKSSSSSSPSPSNMATTPPTKKRSSFLSSKRLTPKTAGTIVTTPPRPPSHQTYKKILQRCAARSAHALAELQNELLLLDDILMVGLTTLNEQAIEMSFATFVYPFFLETLLLCVRHPGESPAGGMGSSCLLNDSKESNWERLSPARSALVCLSAVFQSMSNKPFLRLVATALLHPLSPNSSSEPRQVKIRATKASGDLRLEDGDTLKDDEESSKRRSFAFGRNYSSHLSSLTSSSNIDVEDGSNLDGHGDDNSVNSLSNNSTSSNMATYVLAPALADILDGDCLNTKPNPYRRVLLACLRRGGGRVNLECGGSLQSAAAVCMDSAIVSMKRHSLRNVLEACGALPRLISNKSKSAMDVLLLVEGDNTTTTKGEDLKSDFDGEAVNQEAADQESVGKEPIRERKNSSVIITNNKHDEDDLIGGDGRDNIDDDDFDGDHVVVVDDPAVRTMRERAISGISDILSEDEDEDEDEDETGVDVGIGGESGSALAKSPTTRGALHALQAAKISQLPSPNPVQYFKCVAELISALCSGLITTPNKIDGIKSFSYGLECAHALMMAVEGDDMSRKTARQVCCQVLSKSGDYIIKMAEKVCGKGGGTTAISRDAVNEMLYLVFTDVGVKKTKGRMEIALNATGTSYKCQQLRSSVMLPAIDVDGGSGGGGEGEEEEDAILEKLAGDESIVVPEALKKCAMAHLQLASLVKRFEGEKVVGEENTTEIYGELGDDWKSVIHCGVCDTHTSDSDKNTTDVDEETVSLVGKTAVPCVCSIIDDAGDTHHAGENHLDALYDSGLVSSLPSKGDGGVKWINLFFVSGDFGALFVEKDDAGGKVVGAVEWKHCRVSGTGDGRKLVVIDMKGGNKGVVFENGSTASVWFEDGEAREEARGIFNERLVVARVEGGNLVREMLS